MSVGLGYQNKTVEGTVKVPELRVSCAFMHGCKIGQLTAEKSLKNLRGCQVLCVIDASRQYALVCED
ncbi:hypothetical protein M0802_004644 [Mischocyttarus mexicanus]|nr:hypothetical protein M0802_004644 [Mischocyttarus mexicanus]